MVLSLYDLSLTTYYYPFDKIKCCLYPAHYMYVVNFSLFLSYINMTLLENIYISKTKHTTNLVSLMDVMKDGYLMINLNRFGPACVLAQTLSS